MRSRPTGPAGADDRHRGGRLPATVAFADLFNRLLPRKIIQTGVDSGPAIEMMLRIARCGRDHRGPVRVFYALTGSPEAYLDAMRALRDAGLLDDVQVLLGSSLAARDVTRFTAPPQRPGTHSVSALAADRFVPENLLGRCLEDFDGRPDLVVLSSPARLALSEARLVLSGLGARCRLLVPGDTPEHRTLGRRLRAACGPGATQSACTDPAGLLFTARPAGRRPAPSLRPRSAKDGRGAGGRRLAIAIVLIEHMGDIVACEPVARHVRRQYPDAFITWVVMDQYRELVEHHPCVDEVLTVGCITEWNLLSMSGLYDKVINLHINGRNCPHCGCFPVARWKTRHDVTLDDYYDHGSLLPVFSSCAGLPPLTEGPRVYIPDEVRRRVDGLGLPGEYIVFHCSSNEDSRDWGDDKWKELVRLIKRRWNGAIVEIGTRACAAASAPGDVVNLCGRLSLLESAEVIRRARVFVGVDSGPAHFANAVGTYGVVLLGDYKTFHRYVPYTGDFGSGRNVSLVYPRSGPARLIPPERVAGIVCRRLRARRPGTSPADGPGMAPDERQAKREAAHAPTVVAFYLPQFHPIPENDAWWGKGFTEWVNVLQGKPLFPGHYQPHLPGELGCYDLRLDAVMGRQAEMARDAGIGAFCFWHYWFDGHLLLERPLRQFLEAGPEFPFCLAWANENWSRRWDGRDHETLIRQTYGGAADDRRHFEWLAPFLGDRRYLRVDGRPLFLVYRPFHDKGIRRTLDRWRGMAEKAGLGRPYFAAVTTHFDGQTAGAALGLGFDAEVMFQPNSRSARDRIFSRLREKRLLYPWLYTHESTALDQRGTVVCEYDEAWPMMAEANAAHPDAWPCVVPSWDNTARRPGQGAFILDRATPLAFGRWLEIELTRAREKKRGPRLVFVNAWNEWAEGCHLEPDLRFGSAYLEATKRVLGRPPENAGPAAVALRRAHENGRYQPVIRRLVRCLHDGTERPRTPATVSHTPPHELMARIVGSASDAVRAGDNGPVLFVAAIRELLKTYDTVPLLTQLYNAASNLVQQGKAAEARLLFAFVAETVRDWAPDLCGKCHFKLAQLTSSRSEVIGHLARCLELYPEHAAARQQLRALRRMRS